MCLYSLYYSYTFSKHRFEIFKIFVEKVKSAWVNSQSKVFQDHIEWIDNLRIMSYMRLFGYVLSEVCRPLEVNPMSYNLKVIQEQ